MAGLLALLGPPALVDATLAAGLSSNVCKLPGGWWAAGLVAGLPVLMGPPALVESMTCSDWLSSSVGELPGGLSASRFVAAELSPSGLGVAGLVATGVWPSGSWASKLVAAGVSHGGSVARGSLPGEVVGGRAGVPTWILQYSSALNIPSGQSPAQQSVGAATLKMPLSKLDFGSPAARHTTGLIGRAAAGR